MTTTTLPSDIQNAAAQVAPAMQQWADQMLQWLRAGQEFAANQAPDLIRQILTWGLASSAFWAGFGLLIIVLGEAGRRWLIRNGVHFKEIADYPHPGPFFGYVGVLLAYVAGGVTILHHVYTIVQILAAPKLYLLEYLVSLTHTQ